MNHLFFCFSISRSEINAGMGRGALPPREERRTEGGRAAAAREAAAVRRQSRALHSHLRALIAPKMEYNCICRRSGGGFETLLMFINWLWITQVRTWVLWTIYLGTSCVCVSLLSGGTDTSIMKEMFGSGAVIESRKCDHVAASDSCHIRLSGASEDLHRFTPFSYQFDRIKPHDPPHASQPLRTLTPRRRQLVAQIF